jgi:hypothetical protein
MMKNEWVPIREHLKNLIKLYGLTDEARIYGGLGLKGLERMERLILRAGGKRNMPVCPCWECPSFISDGCNVACNDFKKYSSAFQDEPAQQPKIRCLI